MMTPKARLDTGAFRLTPVRPWWMWAIHGAFVAAVVIGLFAGMSRPFGVGLLVVEAWIVFGSGSRGGRIRPGDKQVVLHGAGGSPARVAAVVMSYVGGTVLDARSLVDRAPCPIGPPVVARQAQIVVARLRRAGAIVTVNTVTPISEGDGGSHLFLEAAGATPIAVIKALREIFDGELVEAKGWVEGAPTTVGHELSAQHAEAAVQKLRSVGATARVTTQARQAVAGAVAGATPPVLWVPAWSTSGDTARLVLEAPGEKKIAVIRALCDVFDSGLAETKSLVDSAPSQVGHDLRRPDAEAAAERLRALGATVSLVARPDGSAST